MSYLLFQRIGIIIKIRNKHNTGNSHEFRIGDPV